MSLSPETSDIGKIPQVIVVPRLQDGIKAFVSNGIEPDRPHAEYLEQSNKKGAKENFNSTTFARVLLPDHGELLITRTIAPYVRNGTHFMIVAQGGNSNGEETQIETFADLTKPQADMTFKTMGMTARYFSEMGDFWFLGTSVSTDEWQRQAPQTLKYIHIHAVKFARGDYDLLEPLPLSDRDNIRQMSDPLHPLLMEVMGRVVMNDEIRKDPAISQLLLDEQPGVDGYPRGFFLEHSLDEMFDGSLAVATQTIHRRMEEVYWSFINSLAIPYDKNDKYSRLQPLPRSEALENLGQLIASEGFRGIDTKRMERMLKSLLSRVKSPYEVLEHGKTDGGNGNELENMRREERLRNTRWFLRGMGYTHLIYPNQGGSLTTCIVPRIMSGGSPLESFGILKNQIPVDGDEWKTVDIPMIERVVKYCEWLNAQSGWDEHVILPREIDPDGPNVFWEEE